MINNPTGGWKLCHCGKKYQGKCDHKPRPRACAIRVPAAAPTDDGLPDRIVGHGGFVYVLWAEGTDIYKVGRTKNLRQRIKGIQFVSPLPVKLLGYQFSVRPHKKEEMVHQHFATQRLHGEWFRLTQTELATCMSLLY